LRFFTVYGPRQRPDLAIRKFVRAVLDGKEITVYGDGNSRRDYTHVNDTVRGIISAANWCADSEPRYGIFNLGSAHPVELRQLITKIEQFTGLPALQKSMPPQPGDVSQTFADTSRAEMTLGFRHEVNFDTGLRDFVEWMRKQQG
jgi:UDP-glucuronate 4-epimerase